MTGYRSIEADIATQLASILVPAGVEVKTAPNSQQEYGTPTGPRVTVAFMKSDFETQGSRSVTAIECVSIGIFVDARSIASPGRGAYAILEVCKRILLGYKPEGGTAISLDKIDVVTDEKGQNIGHVLVIKTDLYNVSDVGQEQVLGELLQVVLNEPEVEFGDPWPTPPIVPNHPN